MKITKEHIKAAYPELNGRLVEWIDTINTNAYEVALLEQGAQDQFVTADEARALGAGNAEFQTLLEPYEWILCSANCQYMCAYKYRAIRKEVPTCQVQLIDGFTSGEVIIMTREAAKKLQAETKDACDWFFPDHTNTNHWEPIDFNAEGIYTYKRKANLVKLDGVLMTREAAFDIWESKKDTCALYFTPCGKIDWMLFVLLSECEFGSQAEYQLRPKAKKPVSWTDMPAGVALTFYGNRCLFLGASETKALISSKDGLCATGIDLKIAFDEKALTLAPADQQPWLNWRGGDRPVPDGVLVEVTCRSGNRDKQQAIKLTWGHSSERQRSESANLFDIIEYRVIGIAEGYKLEGSK